MKPRALNVLRHPRRPWSVLALLEQLGLQGRGLDGLRSFLVSGALGLIGGLGLGGWGQAQHSALLRERQDAAQQRAVQATQKARQREAQAQQRLRDQQQAGWRALQAQQQRWLDLQAALQREAGRGLRLQRWQTDGQRLLLQGQLPQAEALPALQARLGQALGQPWTLHSLGQAPSASGLSWTLETPWAAASEPKPAAKAAP